MEPMTTFQLLERYLDLSADRHQLIVNNMANIDTPGYRTRDLDFRHELQRAMTEESPLVTPVTRLDRESLLLSEAQIQFRIGVQLIRREFSRLLTAINGGGASSS